MSINNVLRCSTVLMLQSKFFFVCFKSAEGSSFRFAHTKVNLLTLAKQSMKFR